MAMRVIVCGSRELRDERLVWAVLDKLRRPVVIVHGGCRNGADEHAKLWCSGKEGVTEEEHLADWIHGKGAGMMRNAHMASLGADVCIAFWNGYSNGTQDMMRQATRAGIPVRVVPLRKT